MQPMPVKKPVSPWAIIGWILVGSFVVCGGGCGVILGITALGSTVSMTTTSTSEVAASSDTPEAPPATLYTMQEDNGLFVTVLVDSADNLQAVLDQVRANLGGDSRQVFIDCVSTADAPIANRLATGAYAETARGAQQTGLEVGGQRLDVNEGATCP